jgi:Domain of unknown function (DUF4124)
MKPIYFYPLISIIVALLLSTQLSAQGMYKHVDEQGRVTYSNTPIKGGKKLDLPPLSTVTLPAATKAAPKPVAEPDKESRRKALQAELEQEEKALQNAKTAAKEAADKPEVFTRTKTVAGPDGKPTQVTETGRNVAAYEEKMKKLNEEVALREKYVAKLKAELADLDGKKEDKK